jgi:methionyl-tRNA formyltransferase
VKIAFASSSSVALPVFHKLLNSKHEVLYCISNPDKRVGRGQDIKSNAFVGESSEFVPHVIQPETNSQLQEYLEKNPVDLVVTIAYGRLIKAELLRIPRFGWINVHFSLLPHLRGAAPVQYALLRGETSTGISIFQLDEGMDTGPLYVQEVHEIAPEATTESLLSELGELAAQKILKVINDIENGVPAIPQRGEATFAPKILKEAGQITSAMHVSEAIGIVRALGENPGAFIRFRGERLNIVSAQASADSNGEVGSLIASKDALWLQLKDGAIELTSIKPQGRKIMSGADYARGSRILPGEKLDD